MTKRRTQKNQSGGASKPTCGELAEALRGKHRHFGKAVHAVLRDAGLKGVKVHSIRFQVAPDSISGQGCNPPCEPDEVCVLDSSDGEVKWVCVPR